MSAELIDSLTSYCFPYDIRLTNEQSASLVRHLELVQETNKCINLTRITSLDDALILHILDSLLAWKVLSARFSPTDVSVNFLDMGTGAGYPGVCFSIMSEWKATLLDSVGKKVKAVESFCKELGLDDVECVHDRLESYALSHRHIFNFVVARAVASFTVLMEYATPFIKKDGILFVMKANPSLEELEAAERASKVCGLSLVSRETFDLPRSSGHREIFLYKLVSNPSIKLPRQVGKARKEPLA